MRLQAKITIITAVLAVASAVAFGFTVLKYFSPNNDGTRDVLEIPFSATDNGRIVSWKMVVENNRGAVVRTIGNKVALPAKITAGQVVRQLGKAKESIIIPESVSWDGTMDDGTMAPDGEYFYYISVVDEDGNEGKSKKYNVILDNTKPDCTVTVPEGEDLVFGEGAKGVFNVKQNGSKERKWTGLITDRDGKAVRTLVWENSTPQNFTWDGTDDKGMIVPDGIYNYALVGEDRAGNLSDEKGIKNIIFSAEKPATNISIAGNKYFSVASKSAQDKISLSVDIPVPVSSANKLVNWSVTVFAKGGQEVRTYNAKTNGSKPVTQIDFDGKDNSGKLIPEGEYYAQVKAQYLNGYETLPVNTSIFVFDTTEPGAGVTADGTIFSPDGDGRKDFMTFKLVTDRKGGSPIKEWNGKINTSNGETVMEYKFGTFCPQEVTWNGLDMNGKPSRDGDYEFVLTGTDMAGNTVTSKTPERFALDTSKTEVLLAASDLVISPNGDGVQDSITFTPIVKENVNAAKYNFEIKNQNGKAVYALQASGKVPAKILWNGTGSDKKTVADGKYTASLLIESQNGSQAKVDVPGIIIDTKAPYIEISSAYTLFSPDGDGKKDAFVLDTKNCSNEDIWTVKVLDKNGKKVRGIDYNKYVGGAVNSSFRWDGTDEAGNKVSDGVYRVMVSSEDAAGNKCVKTVDNVVVDTRAVKAFVTAAYEGISPLSETGLNKQKFNLRTTPADGIKSWSFDVVSEKGEVYYKVSGDEKSKQVPKEVIWDGINPIKGTPCEGTFYGRLSIEYEKGNVVDEKSSSFICSGTAPVLTVKTTPDFFSPDNDGVDDDLFIKLGAKCAGKITKWSFIIYNPDESGRKDKPFWTTSGTTKITEQLTWNGLSNVSKEKNGQAERVQSAMDYPWEFTVTDSLGLTTKVRGKISIDILVIRDGSVLKMAVPAIIFRSNAADFKTAKEAPGSKVTPEQQANNERVLKRVADILKKFPDYTITVVGHANNITGTEAEETSTENGNIPLIPLSQSRAEFVKSKLNAYGIEANRMTTVGKGGRERIAALNDRENWWKNRRVEFLLHK